MSIYYENGKYIVKVCINGRQILRRKYLGKTILDKKSAQACEKDLYISYGDMQKDYEINDLLNLYDDYIFKRYKELYNEILKIYEPWDIEKQYLDNFIREILLAIVGSSILIKEKHQNNDFKEEKRIISFIKEPDKDKFSSTGSYQAYKFIDKYLIKYNLNKEEIQNVVIEFLNVEKYNVDKIGAQIFDVFNEDNDEFAVDKFEKILKLIEDDNLNVNIIKFNIR